MLQIARSQLEDTTAGGYVLDLLTYGIRQVQIFTALEHLYGPFILPYLATRKQSCVGQIVEVLN